MRGGSHVATETADWRKLMDSRNSTRGEVGEKRRPSKMEFMVDVAASTFSIATNIISDIFWYCIYSIHKPDM